MTDLGSLSVDLPGGPVMSGWRPAEHPGIAVLAVPTGCVVFAAIIGAAFARSTAR